MPNTSELLLEGAEPKGAAAPRWDPLARLTHSEIAAAILVNCVVYEEGSLLHLWIGYGPGARFGTAPTSPPVVVYHRSHSPLGALMVYNSGARMRS